MAFKAAYNQFSGASGYFGRHGALKVVIFETDGVPNTIGDGTFVNGGAYRSYYNSIAAGSYLGNGNATVVSQAVAAVSQILPHSWAWPESERSAETSPNRGSEVGISSSFESAIASPTLLQS
jgi:hypothetical protein